MKTNDLGKLEHKVYLMDRHNKVCCNLGHTFFLLDVNKIPIDKLKHTSLLIINHINQGLMDIYRHTCLTNCQKINYCNSHPYMFWSISLPMIHLDNDLHIIWSRSLQMLVMDIHLHRIVKVQRQKILMDTHLNIHYEFSFGMRNSKLNIFEHIFVSSHQQNFHLWL